MDQKKIIRRVVHVPTTSTNTTTLEFHVPSSPRIVPCPTALAVTLHHSTQPSTVMELFCLTKESP